MDNKKYFIYCRTGCSCCSNENHYRGPFVSKEDAEKRIAYFLSPDSKYWPVASQYARRGRYEVIEANTEEISNDRFIWDDKVYDNNNYFILVKNDGSLFDDSSDWFCYDN